MTTNRQGADHPTSPASIEALAAERTRTGDVPGLSVAVAVVLAGDATDLVIEDNIQRLEGVGEPPPEYYSASSKSTRFPPTSERGAR